MTSSTSKCDGDGKSSGKSSGSAKSSGAASGLKKATTVVTPADRVAAQEANVELIKVPF